MPIREELTCGSQDLTIQTLSSVMVSSSCTLHLSILPIECTFHSVIDKLAGFVGCFKTIKPPDQTTRLC